MSQANPSGNKQFVAIILCLAIFAAIWFFARRAQVEAVRKGDSSLCWTASCRDAVIQRNREVAAGKAVQQAN